MNNILPPPAILMHLAAGKFVTQALAAAAELNVTEQLVDGPKTHRRSPGPWECMPHHSAEAGLALARVVPTHSP